MNYLENICFLCLAHEQNVTSQGDIGSTIQEMLEYIVPEYVVPDLNGITSTMDKAPKNKALKKCEISRNICDNCTSSLNYIFEFRQRCLKSIRIYNEYIQNLLEKNDKYSLIESTDILQNVKCETSAEIEHKVEQKEEEPNFHKEIKIEMLDEDYESSIRENHSETSHIKIPFNEELMIEDDDFQENLTEFENSAQDVAEIDNTIPNEHFHSIDMQEDISLVEEKQDECIPANDVPPNDANKSDSKRCFHKAESECRNCQKLSNRLSQSKRQKPNRNTKKLYSCDVCLKSFDLLGNLKTHKRMHGCEESHFCEICQKSFTRLEEHKRVHAGNRAFTCDVCRKSFAYSGDLTKHKRIHSGERPHACDVCQKVFTQLSTLTNHRRIHSEKRPFKCDLCQNSFKQLGTLTKHKLVHTGQKSFKCDVCQKSFAVFFNLKRHRRIHEEA